MYTLSLHDALPISTARGWGLATLAVGCAGEVVEGSWSINHSAPGTRTSAATARAIRADSPVARALFQCRGRPGWCWGVGGGGCSLTGGGGGRRMLRLDVAA